MKSSIWNDTALAGEPVAPWLVAERHSGDECPEVTQYQSPSQVARLLPLKLGKNRPFEPESMKLYE